MKQLTHRNSITRRSAIQGGFMGVIVGLTFFWVAIDTKDTALSVVKDKHTARVLVDPPDDIAALVEHAGLIVKGELGSISQQTTFAGYDHAGDIIPVATVTNQTLPGLGTPTPTRHPPLEIPLTDLQLVNVGQVIRDCDNVVGVATVEVRMISDPPATQELATDEASEYPFGQEGDYRLFFLSKTPDEEAYGLYYGPCSRLALDDSEVACSDGDRTQLSFMEEVSDIDFIHAVETEVAEQSCP